jgi:hypothetical protein
MHFTYRVGNEHAPDDPFGRSELVIERDGSAYLAHFEAGARPRSWRDTVLADPLARLHAALTRAGFPAVPDHIILPGGAIRILVVDQRAVMIEWHAARRMPGYDEAFALLDAIANQLSDGAVKRTPAGPVRLLSGCEAAASTEAARPPACDPTVQRDGDR